MRSVIRQLLPVLLVPLCLIASALSATPWLRAFPVSIAGLPIYGAALVSVAVPLVVVRIRPAWLWLSALLDVLVFVFYTLTVVLRNVSDLGALGQGLYRSPAQVLTFALPLVSPRSLMVAPVALVWVAGALAGECLARRWYTLLPYVGFLVGFGLAYAATQRAADTGSAAAAHETALGASLLATLLLMRVAQAWLQQDEAAESTDPEGLLPLRGLVVGTATTLVVAVVAGLAVHTDVFPRRASTPQRVPSVNDSTPVAPLAFVSGLRPAASTQGPRTLFTVRVDAANPGYFPVANVDFYDGSGWTFDRTFRPSGGVLPADTDTQLQGGRVVTQDYRIAAGPLTAAPWMPFMYRAQRVTGIGVNIDPASGMLVPAGHLAAGTSYTVRSTVATATFAQLRAARATPDTATPTIDTQLPATVRPTLDRLISSFAAETGVASSPPLPFLQALQRDLLTRYALSTPAHPATNAPSTTVASSARPGSARSGPASAPSTTAVATPSGDQGDGSAGSAGFADVLASILGQTRSGTPEQYATLVALVARELGVPARVVTGFRIEPPRGATTVGAGTYQVTDQQAWTWAEIPIAGEGWVVLDAAPGRFTAGRQPTQSAAPAPHSSAPPSQNALASQSAAGHALARPSRVPHAVAAPSSAVLIAALAVIGAIIVALLLVLLLRKPLRAARRRRAPDPRRRLIGAWQESLDVLVEAGLPELTALTSTEIAELAGAQFGAPAGAEAASLGTAANAVVYSTTAAVAPGDADLAWARHQVLRQQIGRRLGVRGRVTARLRYHRRDRAALPVSPRSWADASADERARARRYPGRRRAH